MKNISFRFPTSIRDIKVLWKEYTSKRYRKNIEVMRKPMPSLRKRWRCYIKNCIQDLAATNILSHQTEESIYKSLLRNSKII